MRRVVTSVLCLMLSVPLFAQEQEADSDGSKDHPMLSRMPGYYISVYNEQEFGTHDFFKDAAQDQTQTVEGHYWYIEYNKRESAKSIGPLQIIRNYVNALTRQGAVKICEQVDSEKGSTTLRLPTGGKSIWVYVYAQGDAYELTVVEEAGMKQDVEFTAAELSKQLNEQGSVAIRGILFDTGKATIKPESEGALAQILELLKNDSTLKLEIQGHTDNVGAQAANLKLSQDRAAAVKAHLVTKGGIDAARLTTLGFGDSKPVADNSTEEGRAQNRRVELVKR
ncbi:MAG: OmpA family protein [Acidobacteriota bacterium]